MRSEQPSLGRPGLYHPRAHCAYCGAAATRVELRTTAIKVTHALALVCVDVSACLRRRARRAEERAA